MYGMIFTSKKKEKKKKKKKRRKKRKEDVSSSHYFDQLKNGFEDSIQLCFVQTISFFVFVFCGYLQFNRGQQQQQQQRGVGRGVLGARRTEAKITFLHHLSGCKRKCFFPDSSIFCQYFALQTILLGDDIEPQKALKTTPRRKIERRKYHALVKCKTNNKNKTNA